MVHMFWPIVMAQNKNELSNTKLTTITSVIMIIIMGTLNAQTVLALSAYRFFKHTKYINNKASVHTHTHTHTRIDQGYRTKEKVFEPRKVFEGRSELLYKYSESNTGKSVNDKRTQSKLSLSGLFALIIMSYNQANWASSPFFFCDTV